MKKFVVIATLVVAFLSAGAFGTRAEGVVEVMPTEIFCRDQLAINEILDATRKADETGDVLYYAYQGLQDTGRCDDVPSSELSFLFTPTAESCEIVDTFCVAWGEAVWRSEGSVQNGYSVTVVYEIGQKTDTAQLEE